MLSNEKSESTMSNDVWIAKIRPPEPESKFSYAVTLGNPNANVTIKVALYSLLFLISFCSAIKNGKL